MLRALSAAAAIPKTQHTHLPNTLSAVPQAALQAALQAVLTASLLVLGAVPLFYCLDGSAVPHQWILFVRQRLLVIQLEVDPRRQTMMI